MCQIAISMINHDGKKWVCGVKRIINSGNDCYFSVHKPTSQSTEVK